MITSKELTALGVRHTVVCEPHEEADYRGAAVGLLADIVVLDLVYKEKYSLCDSHGLTKSTGPGPARNFIWDHSIAAGHAWHWVMDDNISNFYRWNENLKVRVSDGAIFYAMEEFVLRYQNIAMAGPNYFMFASRKSKGRTFTLNTRIYSCNLIRNDVPFRWRGRYNEDTILSLDMLKASWCTVLFNAFLQFKGETQKLPGGNTDDIYHVEGRRRPGMKYADGGTTAKSAMLARVHPDVAKVVWRFRRVHHLVDYRPFKATRLAPKARIKQVKGVNDFGMKLKIIKENYRPRAAKKAAA